MKTKIHKIQRRLKFPEYLLLFLIVLLSQFSTAQTAISSYMISEQDSELPTLQTFLQGYPVISPANAHFPTARSYDIYYGQKSSGAPGISRIVTGFVVGEMTFVPYSNQTASNSFSKIVFNRKEPAVPLGEKYTGLYEYSSIQNSSGTEINDPFNTRPLPNDSKVFIEASFESTLEGFMNSYSLNKGADNIFINTGSNTTNNIERIDLIYSNGVIATESTQLNRIGFLLNERGGNDNVKVAAITAIDENGNVSALGSLTNITSAHWGQVGPSIKTVVIQKNGNSTVYQPSQIVDPQVVSGVFVSLGSLSIPINTTIYGIAVFPDDVGSDLLTLADAATGTGNEFGGLDLMSGNFVAREISLSYPDLSGTVFHDANGLKITGLVDGTGIGAPAGTPLYANLLDGNNNVALSVEVDLQDGTYQFKHVTPGNYTVQISLNRGTVLSPAPEALLPTGWVYTGESNDGLGDLYDDTPDGLAVITMASVDVENINFGIQQLPDSKSLSHQISQPALGDLIILNGKSNPPVLQGIDPEDLPVEGELVGRTIVITSVPSNSELYYDLSNGLELLSDLTTITDFDPDKLQIKIVEATIGETETVFSYAFVDVAGFRDPSPATYTISWPSALPVRLAEFEVVAENLRTVLRWSTTRETNSDHFEVQHSLDGKEWSFVGMVGSKVESHTTENYSLEHALVGSGINYYRLKIVDKDGSYEYSTVRSIVLEENFGWIYPNPSSNIIYLNHDLLHQLKSVEMVSSTGVLVHMTDSVSVNEIKIDHLPNGIYLLRLNYRNGHKRAQRVILSK